MSTRTKTDIPVLVLYGPTASGKTAFVCEVLSGLAEVISADSRQVYKQLDIGTAKPTLSEQNQIPHHMIDMIDANEQFTVGQFVHEADRLVREIHGRGKLPIICGGTGYYIRNFLYGLPDSPSADLLVRENVMKELAINGLPFMYARLKELDPERALAISCTDQMRICRALEIIRQTGKKASEFGMNQTYRPGYRISFFRLDMERELLYDRINQRVKTMFENGLAGEISGLRDRGFQYDWPGMNTIGYAEFELFENGALEDLQQVADLIAKNSRHYAKRQQTFGKSFSSSTILQGTGENSRKMLADAAEQLIGT